MNGIAFVKEVAIGIKHYMVKKVIVIARFSLD